LLPKIPKNYQQIGSVFGSRNSYLVNVLECFVDFLVVNLVGDILPGED
jgi:hypothetical protein